MCYRAVLSFVYYGLSMSSGSLLGDFHLNNILNGLVEIPPVVALSMLMNAIDRRMTIAASMILGGICLLLIIPFYYTQGRSLCFSHFFLSYKARL